MAATKATLGTSAKQYTALRLPLNPNKSQEAMFWRCAGTARWAYNWTIAECKSAWERGDTRPTAYELQRQITALKKQAGTQWLSEVSCYIPAQAIFAADDAYRRFFHKLKAGQKCSAPKFKRRGKCRVSFAFNGVAAFQGRSAFKSNKLRVPLVGKVRVARRHFDIPDGSAIRLTIVRYADRWYASILYEVPAARFVPNGKTPIGVDLGLKDFATLSTGESIAHLRPLRSALRRLKRAQRRLSRSQKGSNRRNTKRRIVGRIHARVRNIRQSFIHAFTARLSKNHGQVVIEDLAVRNMMSNRHLAFAIGDSGWSEVKRQLAYKCPRYGAELIVADRFYPSSKTCSACGEVLDSLPLKVREWTCAKCGTVHDRDVNAAMNLKQLTRNTGEGTRVEIGNAGQEQSCCAPVMETRSLTRDIFLNTKGSDNAG